MQVNSNVDMQDEKNSDEVEDENEYEYDYEYEYDRKANHAYLKNHKNMDFRSVAKKGFKDQ